MDDTSPTHHLYHENLDIALDDVIDFLHRNPQYLQNEINPYSVDKLMMLLDNDKLSALEEEFNEHPNGIELPDFVLLLKSTINHPPEDKYRLVSGLIRLFQDIDINGDGHMEWSEFTQYIIDAVIGEKDTKFFDARFEKNRELTEHEILDKAYSRKTKRYVASRIIDNTVHLSQIKRICYCPQSDSIAVLEEGNKKVKMYDTETAAIKDNFEPNFEEKAFILDCCFSERLNMVACVISDRRLVIWENNSGKKEVANVKQDVLPTGIWYLENHKVWIVAGADNAIRSYTYGTTEKTESPYDNAVLLAHTKKITDVLEISIPKLVATSSLDGTIKLWDLVDKMLVTELKEATTVRGIRGMTYSFDYGGNLLSFGFETHINIWCPEVSLTRSYVGKLEGHSHTVICCKFIAGSPNCVSADDKGNVRIWDIRGLSTIQVISAETTSILVTELTIIPRYDKFVIGGKRLTFYENSAVSKSSKHFGEDIYPLCCHYNHYFQTLVVLTKIDLRIYDILTGKLRKVFTDLTDERFSGSDLSSFAFGGKHRKFYLGDNSGLIRVYNMKNGECIHRVNLYDDEQRPGLGRDYDKRKVTKKLENSEISQLIYLSDEKVLITASWDSTIKIYDESESDDSTLLRVMSGAHRDSDINAMAYSSHLNLLATGSGNGLIAVWDLDLVKLEQVCLGHTSEITSIQFAEPFPIMISSSSDGSICIWGVRPCAELYRYKCIMRILNSIWRDDGTEVRPGVTALAVETESRVGIKRQPIKDFPSAHDYVNFHNKNMTRKHDSKSSHSSHHKKHLKGANEQDSNMMNDYMINEDAKSLGVEFLEDTHFGPLNKPTDSLGPCESLNDFATYRELHDADQKTKKRRCYVYYGDQKGAVNILDLTEVLKKRDFYPCKTEKRSESYQLRRKERVDVSKIVENLLSNEKLRRPPYTIHTFNTVLLNRWEGHSQPITNITKVDDPRSLITCSLDKYVKVWSLEGELHGYFNLLRLGKKAWDFPFDWVKQKLKEMDGVFSVLNFIEKDEVLRLSPAEKEAIKLKYLATSFGNENEFLYYVRAYKNKWDLTEKKVDNSGKNKDQGKKDFEIPAYLQPEIEETEKDKEKNSNKEKEKGKITSKLRSKSTKDEKLDRKDSVETKKTTLPNEYKGLAQRIFMSLEKYERKEARKDTQGSHHTLSKAGSKTKMELKNRASIIKRLDLLDALQRLPEVENRRESKVNLFAARGSVTLRKNEGFSAASQPVKALLPILEGGPKDELALHAATSRTRGSSPFLLSSASRPLLRDLSAKSLRKELSNTAVISKQRLESPDANESQVKLEEGGRTSRILARKMNGQMERFVTVNSKIFSAERQGSTGRSDLLRSGRTKESSTVRGRVGNLSGTARLERSEYDKITSKIFGPESSRIKISK